MPDFEANKSSSPHHHCVCMVTATYPTHVTGTGVLVDYEGYKCVVAGTHLLSSPVAASKALVQFFPPGVSHPVTAPLRPEALFEHLGRDNLVSITACDRPTNPTMAVQPALLAPAEFADSIQGFLQSGRLQSSIHDASIAKQAGCDLSGSTNAKESTAPGSRQLRRSANDHKPGEITAAHVRRGAVVPGSRAYRSPDDPDPLSTTVGEAGIILMEVVAHAHGRNKRAYSMAVPSPAARQAAERRGQGRSEGGGQAGGAFCSETQGGGRVAEGWTGEGEEEGRRQGRGNKSAGARKQSGGAYRKPQWTGGGSGSFRHKSSHADDEIRREGPLDCLGNDDDERKGRCRADTCGTANIPAVIVETEALDGVHGAPVFLGRKLFGFTIQERVGEHVTGVIPASTFGLLPHRPAETPTRSIIQQSPRGDTAQNASYPADVAFGTSSREGGVDTTLLLAKMLHLFVHGTPLSLEMELQRVGAEALRALRTPDGRSLVHLAAMSKRLVPLEFVHRRLLMDVAFEEVSSTGNTALHIAAYCGRVQCLQYLCAQGGIADKKNRYGQTPTMMAVLTGRTEILEWLRESNRHALGTRPRRFPEESLEMVEDMDEAAVYGSPMHCLLSGTFSVGGNDSDESDSSEQSLIAAAPGAEQPPLVQGLKGPNPDTDREKMEPTSLAREDAETKRTSPANEHEFVKDEDAARGDEGGHLRSTTLEYLRGSISAAQFIDEIVGTKGWRGRGREAFIAKAARRMPEDKAWTLTKAYRQRQRKEQQMRKQARQTRLAKPVSSRKATKEDISAETEGGDESSVATIFSLGASVESGSLASSSRWGADLDQAVVLYRTNQILATEVKKILSKAFGDQVEYILPEVLAGLPKKKGRQLARLWHVDNRDHPRPRLSAASGGVREGSRNAVKISGGEVSHPVNDGATGSAVAVTAARDSRNRRIPLGHTQAAQAETKWPSAPCVPANATSPVTKPRRGKSKRQDQEGDYVFGPASSKAASPFTTRASAWSGQKGSPQENNQKGDKTRGADERRGSTGNALPNGVVGEVSRWEGSAASDDDNGAEDGTDHDRSEGGDDTAGATEKNKERESMASEAQRLTSDFATGRLAAPHFFGGMMEVFGEERLLAALPDILKILPEDKAGELKAFISKAKGKAGAGTNARLKQREQAERERQERERQEKETEKQQAIDDAKQLADATNAVKGRKKQKVERSAGASAAADGVDKGKGGIWAPAKHGRKTSNQKKMMKTNDSDDAVAEGGAQGEEKGGTRKGKKGKGAKLKIAGDDPATGDEDVEGGELFEMTGAERQRYDITFSRLSPDGGAISPAKAANTLAKSGLPRNALKRVWELADVERDGPLTRDEWAVAMHLVVCAGAKKMPVPARLPKCLRPPLSAPKEQRQQQQQQQKQKQHQHQEQKRRQGTEEPVVESGAGERRGQKQQGDVDTKAKDKRCRKVDLKSATREFKNGSIKAEDFLPVLQDAFGERELAKMWPKLLPTLPPDRAKQLAKAAGVNLDAIKESSTEGSLPRQVGLKEATAAFKKGDMAAKEYHESVLVRAFGDKLPEMLPQILKALPSDRAAALRVVTEAEVDDMRRLAEEERQQWAMSLTDRRVYDKAFMKLDKDKNGVLSRAEAEPMLKKAIGDRLTESEMAHLWRMADIDGDGSLTREEWAIAYHIMRSVIKRGLKLPSTLPELLGTSAGRRLPSL